MKYAVFSDVHGNLPALETFLNAVENHCDGYICLGDIIGYGPDNDACMEVISALKNVIVLKGNNEELFQTKDLSGCSDLAKDFFEYSFPYFSRFDLLPEIERFELAGFSFCHSIKKKKRWLYLYKAGIINIPENLCIGHTHHQTIFEQNGFTVVNIGSIGQNRQDKSILCYGIFDTETKEISLYQKQYNIEKFLNIMARKGYPKHLIDYYANRKAPLNFYLERSSL